MRASDPFDPDGPTGDLVVTFAEVSDVIEHPDAGLIGACPLMRTGEHSNNGWAALCPPGGAHGRPRRLPSRSGPDDPRAPRSVEFLRSSPGRRSRRPGDGERAGGAPDRGGVASASSCPLSTRPISWMRPSRGSPPNLALRTRSCCSMMPRPTPRWPSPHAGSTCCRWCVCRARESWTRRSPPDGDRALAGRAPCAARRRRLLAARPPRRDARATYERHSGIVTPNHYRWVPGQSTGSLPASAARPLPPPQAQRRRHSHIQLLELRERFPRSDYDRVGGFRELRRSEDWDLWIRMIRAGSPARPDTVTLLYRKRPDSLSGTNGCLDADIGVLESLIEVEGPPSQRRSCDRYGAGVPASSCSAWTTPPLTTSGRRRRWWRAMVQDRSLRWGDGHRGSTVVRARLSACSPLGGRCPCETCVGATTTCS